MHHIFNETHALYLQRNSRIISSTELLAQVFSETHALYLQECAFRIPVSNTASAFLSSHDICLDPTCPVIPPNLPVIHDGFFFLLRFVIKSLSQTHDYPVQRGLHLSRVVFSKPCCRSAWSSGSSVLRSKETYFAHGFSFSGVAAK